MALVNPVQALSVVANIEPSFLYWLEESKYYKFLNNFKQRHWPTTENVQACLKGINDTNLEIKRTKDNAIPLQSRSASAYAPILSKHTSLENERDTLAAIEEPTPEQSTRLSEVLGEITDLENSANPLLTDLENTLGTVASRLLEDITNIVNMIAAQAFPVLIKKFDIWITTSTDQDKVDRLQEMTQPIFDSELEIAAEHMEYNEPNKTISVAFGDEIASKVQNVKDQFDTSVAEMKITLDSAEVSQIENILTSLEGIEL